MPQNRVNDGPAAVEVKFGAISAINSPLSRIESGGVVNVAAVSRAGRLEHFPCSAVASHETPIRPGDLPRRANLDGALAVVTASMRASDDSESVEGREAIGGEGFIDPPR